VGQKIKKKIQAKKTCEINFTKNISDQISFLAFSKMAENQFLNLEKFKTARKAISGKVFDLFDLTSFFAWTF